MARRLEGDPPLLSCGAPRIHSPSSGGDDLHSEEYIDAGDFNSMNGLINEVVESAAGDLSFDDDWKVVVDSSSSTDGWTFARHFRWSTFTKEETDACWVRRRVYQRSGTGATSSLITKLLPPLLLQALMTTRPSNTSAELSEAAAAADGPAHDHKVFEVGGDGAADEDKQDEIRSASPPVREETIFMQEEKDTSPSSQEKVPLPQSHNQQAVDANDHQSRPSPPQRDPTPSQSDGDSRSMSRSVSFISNSSPHMGWMKDADATSCCLCQKKFGIVVRRHHCRTCGMIFCGHCCPVTKGQRICLKCCSSGGETRDRSESLSNSTTRFHESSNTPPHHETEASDQRLPQHDDLLEASFTSSQQPSRPHGPCEKMVENEAHSRSSITESWRWSFEELLAVAVGERQTWSELEAVVQRQRFSGKLTMSSSNLRMWHGGSYKPISGDMSVRCGDVSCKSIPMCSLDTPSQLKEAELILTGASACLEMNISSSDKQLQGARLSSTVSLNELVPMREGGGSSGVGSEVVGSRIIVFSHKDMAAPVEAAFRFRFDRARAANELMRQAKARSTQFALRRLGLVDENVGRSDIELSERGELGEIAAKIREDERAARACAARREKLERAVAESESIAASERLIVMARVIQLWHEFTQLSGPQRHLLRAKAMLEQRVTSHILSGAKFAKGAIALASGQGSLLAHAVGSTVGEMAQRTNALQHLNRAKDGLTAVRANLADAVSNSNSLFRPLSEDVSDEAAGTGQTKTEEGAGEKNSSDVPTIKLVCVGDAGAGKSSLIAQLTHKVFAARSVTTLGVEFSVHHVRDATLQLWDIPGGLPCTAVSPQFYRGAAAVLVVIDATRADRDQCLKKALLWKQDVAEKMGRTAFNSTPVPVYVVGNKVDLLQTENSGFADELLAFANENKFTSMLLTSATDHENVLSSFRVVVDEVLKLRKIAGEANPNLAPKGVGIAQRRAGRNEGQKKKSCCPS